MLKWLKSLFVESKKDINCPHGWKIESNDKLPIKRRQNGFSVCPNCALDSSLKQMGSGIKIEPQIMQDLVDSIKKKS